MSSTAPAGDVERALRIVDELSTELPRALAVSIVRIARDEAHAWELGCEWLAEKRAYEESGADR
jgi:hypothetical protein